MYTPRGIFLDGGWQPSTGESIAVINPATEREIFRTASASAADVDSVVVSARRAFENGTWRNTPLEERISILQRALRLMMARQEELAQLQTAQMGAPISVTRMVARASGPLFEAYIDAARSIGFEYLRRDGGGQSLVRLEPVGVVAAIAPWNGPLMVAINKVIPALLAGCAVVGKPAPETPAEMALLAQLCGEAGVPPGVFNVVPGGRETGEHLVKHPDIDKVAFTGSTATGRCIGELCGPRFLRMSLELGGKSAALMLEDVDVAAAAPLLAASNFSNAGQACIALTRVLVPRSLMEQVLPALCAQATEWKVGDPLDETTTMGPLVTARQRDRVLGYIERGLAHGARLVCGGSRPTHLTRGWFVEPTILTDVTNSMVIAREEIFGPVMSVIPYDTLEEAVAIANDSEYGLHGGVFTRDLGNGLAVAKRIRSGSVSINGFGLTPATPYGGIKGSGIGREHGREGMQAFLETKAYVLPAALADQLAARGTPAG